MNARPHFQLGRALGAGFFLALTSAATAQSLFTADFDDFTAPAGNFNGGQFETGWDLAHSGDLPAWSKLGGGAVHIIDHANQTGDIVNPRNFAVMFWQDNVITLNDEVAANDSGVAYEVTFLASPAVYQAPSQQTGANEGILIEVLNPVDDVIASHNHQPGAWPGGPDSFDLQGDSFQYTGDGTGDVRFRLGPATPGAGRFAGAIDDLSVSLATILAPDIVSFAASPPALAKAGDPLTLDWEVDLSEPLDSLTLEPGGIDALAHTNASGVGAHTLDPGPSDGTTYTLTAVRGPHTDSAQVVVPILPPPGSAVFTADFNDFTAPGGNFNGGQFESNLAVAHTGDLTEWSKSGAGTVHAVDHANVFPDIVNPRDFAVMIWQNNVITLGTPIPGSNDGGAEYQVAFEASPTVYQASSQVTTATDGLLIEVLRADDTVLESHIHEPGPWAGDLDLLPVSFSYVGDASGDVRLRIGPSAFNSGHFGGAIDNVTVSVANALAPKILSFTADPAILSDVADPVTLAWEVELPLDSLVLTPGDVDVLPDTDGAGMGSRLIDPGPDGTTEYALIATRDGESITRKLTVTLPAPEITSFTASPTPLAAGGSLTLSWEIGLPFTSLVLTPGDLDVSANTDGTGAGSITLDPGPAESITYTLTATLGTSSSTADAFARVFTPLNPNAIFSDDFNALTSSPGNFNGAQFESGLDLAHSGILPGWLGSGQNDVHAVDLANQTGNIVNPRDFAVMIWQDNVITQLDPLPGSNNAGIEYIVEFEAGPAVYQAGSQQTGPTDGLLIELLRDDDSVLAEFVFEPGAWAGFPTLVPGSFQYTGDGSGDLRLRVGPSAFGSGRFGGAIDNLTVAPLTSPRVRITDLSHNAAAGELSISWESADGKLYNLRSETDPSSAKPIDWPIFGGHSDLAATPPENTLTIPLPPESERYFVIEEFNAPPTSILADDFEGGQGQWTTGSEGADGTAWELGVPGPPGPAAANSGANCFGTNLTSAYAIDGEVWLRSPEIDLTNAGGATLNYFQFFDIEVNFDLGQVSVLDATNGSVLVQLESGLDGISGDWEQVTKVLPAGALGKVIQIEFRLFTDDFDAAPFAGWYVDDFNLTVP